MKSIGYGKMKKEEEMGLVRTPPSNIFAKDDRMMSDYNNKEELYSRPVRAGKRTYFFDVKATRGKDLYMTITESKRRFEDDGSVNYQKHKIFLYREDFEKFEEGFLDAVDKIQELMSSGEYRDPIAERAEIEESNESKAKDSGDLEFDDL